MSFREIEMARAELMRRALSFAQTKPWLICRDYITKRSVQETVVFGRLRVVVRKGFELVAAATVLIFAVL
jgi:hypothetical protein